MVLAYSVVLFMFLSPYKAVNKAKVGFSVSFHNQNIAQNVQLIVYETDVYFEDI